MRYKLKQVLLKITIKQLAALASLALTVTTIAANQRCWFIMYEDKLPQGMAEIKNKT